MRVTTVRRKRIIVDRSNTYNHNNSKVTLLHGAAAHTWRLRGGDKKGRGRRSPAIRWKEGESGKQNKALEPGDGFSSDTVAVFSDSQLRPLVEGDVTCPSNWYVNSTPGGCFNHVACEIRHCKAKFSPEFVIVAVGTNNMSSQMRLETAETDFKNLLSTIRGRFPHSKTIVLSIPPRLDEFDARLGIYSSAMKKICDSRSIYYHDLEHAFQRSERRLWSFRDSVHLSEDFGLPAFIEAAEKALELVKLSLVNPPEPRSDAGAVHCPDWMWKKLRHHNPMGRLQESREEQRHGQLKPKLGSKYFNFRTPPREMKSYEVEETVHYVPIEVDRARGPIFGNCQMKWSFSAFQKKKNDVSFREHVEEKKKKKAKKLPKNKVKPAATLDKQSMDELDELLKEQSKIEYCIDLTNQTSRANVHSREKLRLQSSSREDTADSPVKKMSVSHCTGYRNFSVCRQVTSMQHGYSRSHTSYHQTRLGTYSCAHQVSCPSSHTLSAGPVCHARTNSTKFRIELNRERRDFAGPISHRYIKSLARVYQIQSWDIQAKVIPKSCPSDYAVFSARADQSMNEKENVESTKTSNKKPNDSVAVKNPSSRQLGSAFRGLQLKLSTTPFKDVFVSAEMNIVRPCWHPGLKWTMCVRKARDTAFITRKASVGKPSPMLRQKNNNETYADCPSEANSNRETTYVGNRQFVISLPTVRPFVPCLGGARPKTGSEFNNNGNVEKLVAILSEMGYTEGSFLTLSKENYREISRRFFNSKWAGDEKHFQKMKAFCRFNKDSILLKLANLARTTSEIDDGKCFSDDIITVNTKSFNAATNMNANDLAYDCEDNTSEVIYHSDGENSESKRTRTPPNEEVKIMQSERDVAPHNIVSSSSSRVPLLKPPENESVRLQRKRNVPPTFDQSYLPYDEDKNDSRYAPFSKSDYLQLTKESAFLGRILGEAVHVISQRRGMHSTENDPPAKRSKRDISDDETVSSISSQSPQQNSLFINTPINDTENENSLYSGDAVRAISRSNATLGDFRGSLKNEIVHAELPDQWHDHFNPLKTSSGKGDSEEALSSAVKNNKLSQDAANILCSILSKYSKFCVWTLGYHHTRLPGSRKMNCAYFKGKANCKVRGCPHNVEFTIERPNSTHIRLHFSGSIFHEKGSLEARNIRGSDRKNLKDFFTANRSALPSEKYREDLLRVDPDSFAAGNLTGVGKSHVAYQQIAAKTRKNADSVDSFYRDVLSLQNELREKDEQEALKLGHTFRNDFGYIQRPTLTNNELGIPLMDQPMTMLYHEHVKNDILYIDATGSLVRQMKNYKRLLYYAAVIRHPYNCGPPMPIAEYITSNHDRFSIRSFLTMIHEKECHKYGSKGLTNPKLILLDFSMALILACLDEFCGESISKYLSRTSRVISGTASSEDLNKPFLHICSFHLMKMCRMNAKRLYNRDQDEKSQIHFAMCLLGRLINCTSRRDAYKIVRRAVMVLKSKFATKQMREALDFLQKSINTFQEQVDDFVDVKTDDPSTTSDEVYPGESESDLYSIDGMSEVSNNGTGPSQSNPFDYWTLCLNTVKLDNTEDSNLELNRYYMPDFCTWLEEKLPYITLWSNLCLGDLHRHNNKHECKLPRINTNTIYNNNTTNAIAETFFSLKKRDRTNLKLSLCDFIRKCWNDNRALGRQFVLGLREGIRKVRNIDADSKRSTKALMKLVKNIDNTKGEDNELEQDTTNPHRVEEEWNKGNSEIKDTNNSTKGRSFQKPPKRKLNFSATTSEKNKHMATKKTPDKCSRKRKIGQSELNSRRMDKRDGNFTSSNQNEDPSMSDDAIDDFSIGYQKFKREIYDQVRCMHSSMAEVTRTLEKSWSKLSLKQKQHYRSLALATAERCSKCGEEDIDGSQDFINWVMCTECEGWYHIACLHLDKPFTDNVPQYVCPKCARNFEGGLPNFIYRLRNFRSEDITEMGNPLERWSLLEDDIKTMIKTHTFPAAIASSVETGPLEILSERGIANPYNNCWSNSIFQIICGSVIFKLLPSRISGHGDEIFDSIYRIHDSLRVAVSDSLPFTTDMKKVVKKFLKCDQTKSPNQQDAVELLEGIISYLLENSLDDVTDHFLPFFTQIVICPSCRQSIFIPIQQFYNMVIRLSMGNLNIKNSSIQSLLWQWLTNNDSFSELTCDCPKTDVLSRSFFLRLPTVLLILTDRVQPNQEGAINHNPVMVNETLHLDDMLAGSTSASNATYRLAAVLCHRGRVATCGHYNCAIFSENGQAIVYDDNSQRATTVSSFLNSKKCKEGSRLLVYVNSAALNPGITPDSSPWNKELLQQDVVEMETVLFGCVDHQSVNLPAVSLRSLIGNRHIHGDVINCFLQGLVISHPDHLVEYLPSFFLSSIIDNARSPNYMTTVALERRNTIFSSNLVYLPYHQSKRSHWSMVGLYPKLKLVVHCDSLPSDAADRTVFNAVATYIAKCNVISNRRDDRKDWTFIPLHKYGLQSQSDGFSCGAFACVFAFSLLSLRDFHLDDVALPLVRYWIGKIALQGSEYVPLKAKPSSQWDDTIIEKCTVRAATIDGFTKGHPPFQSLSSFLYIQVNGTALNDLSSPHQNGNDLKALFDGFSRRKIQNEDNELKKISVEFLQDSSTKAHRLLDEIRNLNPSNQILSQRLNALCSLSTETFCRLAKKEYKNNILPSFGKAANYLSDELYAIVTRTREAEHSTKRKRKREYIYDIDRRFGLGKKQFVEWVLFPELLTRFFMQTRGLTFEGATKHMYGNVADHDGMTVYHDALRRNNGE